MTCGICEREIEECPCPDLADRMRALSDPGGLLASRWCARCDNHYARCYCREPVWRLRRDGQLEDLPS